ncbi:MAG: serine acetyltransferase [Oscillospiraceae bacterium]|nr:serine acetyltransferase [Oscillospiraceae bacterium]
MDNLINRMMESYQENSDENVPDFLPEREEVIRAVSLLRRLLFPGYFDSSGNSACSKQELGESLHEAETCLRRQVCRSLNLEHGQIDECSAMFERAGRLCREFLEKLPDLRDVLLCDVQAAYDGDPAAVSKHEVIFAYPGVFAVTVYRLAHELYLMKIPFIPRMMAEYAHSLTGIEIHPGAEIGRWFFIDHGTGIVIGETAKIGDHAKLYQGVTLGALSTRGGQKLRGKKRHPTLEDEVTVYSGATILGGETVIGKGCVIGGNAFITKPVSPNTKVAIRLPEHKFDTNPQ